MTDLDFDVTQWYNEDDLDYRTPEPQGPDSHSASPADHSQPSQLQRGRLSRQRLPLLQLGDWDPNVPYDESRPTCIHYSIEWKLLLNKGRLKKLTNDTEQNLVLAPGAFWNRTLRSKLQQVLEKKTPRNKCYEPDETNIVISVTDRSHRDLSKRFDELNIDWEVVESQLRAWGHLLLDGKRLRVSVSFIYKEGGEPPATRTRQSTRRGGVTALQLAERTELLEEQEASGQTTVWKEVYSLMRCNGGPCPGPYCWRDEDRKHYRLDSSVLAKLVDYAEEGNALRTHQDVPPWIRELVYAKEQQDAERKKRKRQASVPDNLSPIHITNVLPGGFNKDPGECSALDIPGPRDGAVKRYCEWHYRKVTNAEWQAGFRAACEIVLEDGLDLERLHAAQDIEAKSLVEKGIKRGIAIQFVSRVKTWLDEA